MTVSRSRLLERVFGSTWGGVLGRAVGCKALRSVNHRFREKDNSQMERQVYQWVGSLYDVSSDMRVIESCCLPCPF